MGFFGFGKGKTQYLKWEFLNNLAELKDILESRNTVVFFKHSTRCSVSAMIKSRLENSWTEERKEAKVYLIDLIAFREVSNAIEDLTGVKHESPQVIVMKNGVAVYSATHSSIHFSDFENILS